MPDPALPPVPFDRADTEQTIAARFEAVVRAFPDHAALTGSGQRWTYDALNRRANQIAHAIRARTTPGPGCVAHLFDLSPDMVVGMVAVLKAGKTCLPIHPGTPADAQRAIVNDASPELILASEALAAPARVMAAGACDVLTLADVGDTGPAGNPEPVARPGDPALFVYTSGSTGRPKGVVWSHRRTMHRAGPWTMCELITPADRQSLLRHCGFAAAQTDLLVALLHGATLCVFDVVVEGLAALRTWIDREQITIIRSPTLLFRRFLATLDDGQTFPSVRIVSLGGDTVLPSDLDRWKRHFVRPCALHVRFSTTETAVLTTARFGHDTVLGPEGATAGLPVADKELVVVDAEGRPLPVGEEGDLVVSSAYLADGYWRRPEETARAFTPDPRDPDRQSYRTGDRGRLLPDGRFAFAGRHDQQVKIRGYRVDIREVETMVRQLGDVQEAAVMAVKDGEDQRLLAAIVVRSGMGFDPVSLRERLLAVLPEWKVPSRFFAVEALPTTLSGKVDRKRLKDEALRQEAAEQMAAAASADEPLDPLEERLASLWRRHLRRDRVGPSESFFLLGGDSLQATVLHLDVERLAGVPISVEVLFKQPTVRDMANVVRQVRRSGRRTDTAALPVLVPFRSTGTRTPLFLVHGRPGWLFARPAFLESVGADQPVYGFQAAGLPRTRMRRKIANMAREYVRAMRQVQPQGPYFIGAACSGFLVAIEMANQLRALGETVGPLLLFDPPLSYQPMPRWHRFRRLLRLHLRRLLPETAWHRRKRGNLEARWGHDILQDPLAYETGLRIRVNANLDFAMARVKYTNWHYDGPVLIVSSTKRLGKNRRSGKRRTFGGRLTGELKWFEAGATHHDVIRVETEEAAQQIRQCIDIAHEALAALRTSPPPHLRGHAQERAG